MSVTFCAAYAQHLSTETRHASRTLPFTKFYDVPTPLPAGHPGALIRSQSTDDYELPENVSAFRILYHSQTPSGQDVGASAVVLLPGGKPPAGGWPVLAWAHAFTGQARFCAPSLRRNLLNGPFLAMYANLGYAVVATDYAGLGTSGRNAVMDESSNANDVIYSVAAARAAIPQLGPRWIAFGDSMGGAAAIAVVERQSQIADPGFLGSISVGDVGPVAEANGTASEVASAPAAALLAYAIKTVLPDTKLADVLTDKGLALYDTMENSCAPEASNSHFVAKDVLQPRWQNNPSVKKFFEANALGKGAASRPLLLLNSQEESNSADPMLPLIAALCRNGDRVDYESYPISVAALLGSTVRDQMAWIADRFAGRPAPNHCR